MPGDTRYIYTQPEDIMPYHIYRSKAVVETAWVWRGVSFVYVVDDREWRGGGWLEGLMYVLMYVGEVGRFDEWNHDRRVVFSWDVGEFG
jgi:hypothetical protein